MKNDGGDIHYEADIRLMNDAGKHYGDPLVKTEGMPTKKKPLVLKQDESELADNMKIFPPSGGLMTDDIKFEFGNLAWTFGDKVDERDYCTTDLKIDDLAVNACAFPCSFIGNHA